MKSLMIQETGSYVGKSLIAAGLCRIFKKDRFNVVPFKSQNMSLNSFVTREGREMGRAQVVQAEAAGIEPHVDMNPILLKPSNDTGCQVIILGHPIGNMNVSEYFKYKLKAFDEAKIEIKSGIFRWREKRGRCEMIDLFLKGGFLMYPILLGPSA